MSKSEGCVKRKRTKPKVTQSWPCEDIRLLINSVELHPSIWNLACLENKSLMKREAAWREIETALGNRYGVPECKAKWSNVKTAYQKIENKMRACKSGQSTTPTWSYWFEMQFLSRDGLNHKAVSESNSSPHSHNDNESTSSETEDLPEAPLNPLAIKKEGSVTRKIKIVNSPSPAQSLASESMPRYIKTKENKNGDEWQTVGNYLAIQLRNLAGKNRERAEKLQRKFARMVLDELDELDIAAIQKTRK